MPNRTNYADRDLHITALTRPNREGFGQIFQLHDQVLPLGQDLASPPA
jgi:hypothetical protein